MSSLDHILKFADLLLKFREIERSLLHRNGDRKENDSERSFSLALLGWYINDSYALNLNIEKIMAYALAHDLVEVYAGDTYFYHTDSSVLDSKHEREEQAARQLQDEFPDFPRLHETIRAYERREDEESRFVYALDKIEPVISIYLDNGRTWR
jgi:putative hydrolase of HD superfamily